MAESLEHSKMNEKASGGNSSRATAEFNPMGDMNKRAVVSRTGTPSILDYSFVGYEDEELSEALSNQPSKVFESVETILATNVSLLTVPDVLVHYRNLINLDLSYNQLTFLPDVIVECRNLANIILKNNLLDDTGFPKSLSGLRQLKELNLSGNLLTRIPDSVLDTSSSLVSLYVGANRISVVPKEIGQLKKLQVLYLGGNQLTEIPMEIGYLTQLKIFVLCENMLETLPSTVSNLKQLKSLLLHRNRITALPVELIKLRNLMEVNELNRSLEFGKIQPKFLSLCVLAELAG